MGPYIVHEAQELPFYNEVIASSLSQFNASFSVGLGCAGYHHQQGLFRAG